MLRKVRPWNSPTIAELWAACRESDRAARRVRLAGERRNLAERTLVEADDEEDVHRLNGIRVSMILANRNDYIPVRLASNGHWRCDVAPICLAQST